MITSRDVSVVDTPAGVIIYSTNQPPIRVEVPCWFLPRNRNRLIDSMKSIYLEAVNDSETKEKAMKHGQAIQRT